MNFAMQISVMSSNITHTHSLSGHDYGERNDVRHFADTKLS